MDEPKSPIPSRVRTDLVVIGILVLLGCAAILFDPDRIFEWLAQRRAVQLDEFLVGVVLVGGGFAIFSWRRWTDLTRQVAEYKRLQTELKTINRDSSLLSETDDLLQSCLSSDEAYKIVIHHIETQLPGSSGAIAAITHQRDMVEIVAQWGSPALSHKFFPPEDCLSLRRGRVSLFQAREPRFVCPHFGPARPHYAICLPMIAQGETLGILYVDSGSDTNVTPCLRAPTESQERTIKTLGEHLALTMASLQLREKLKMQAIRDPLTDLFNRRYMEESLERELRRARRRNLDLTVAMVDIDHFKRFNDSYGHEAGDVLLQELATIFRANLRGEDIPCRYGGEEFTLILTEAAQAASVQKAEFLRQIISDKTIICRGETLPKVTVSVGLACYPADGDSVESLLRAADQALYQAKREGRDRVVPSGNPPMVRNLDEVTTCTPVSSLITFDRAVETDSNLLRVEI